MAYERKLVIAYEEKRVEGVRHAGRKERETRQARAREKVRGGSV